MAVVNKITIRAISVERSAQAGEYDLELAWETLESPGPYAGSYTLSVCCDGGEPKVYPVESSPRAKSGRCGAVSLDPAKYYWVTMSTAEKPQPECSEVLLIAASYSGILAVLWEDATLRVRWDMPAPNIAGGRLNLRSCNGGAARTVEVDAGVLSAAIPLEMADCEKDNIWEVTLTSYAMRTAEVVSSGVESDAVRIPSPSADILAVDLKENRLTANIRVAPFLWERREGLALRMALSREGKEILVSGQYPLPDQKSADCSLEWALKPEQYVCDIGHCTLVVRLCSDTGENRLLSPMNQIPLFRPSLSVAARVRRDVTFIWTSGAEPCSGYKLKQGETIQDVAGNSHTLSLCEGMQDVDVAVAPVYADRVGLYSRAVSLFAPGYYPVAVEGGNALPLSLRGHSRDVLAIPITLPLFPQPPALPIETGPLVLDGDSGNYRLLIDQSTTLGRSDFDAFFDLLFQGELSVEGYYLLRDLISRCSCHDLADTLYLYSGLYTGARRADVVPGMFLQIETANYQLQTASTAADNNGFIRGGVMEYAVTMAAQGDNSILTFDAYMDTVQTGWTKSAGGETTLVAAGGLIDFFQSQVRMPYFRLLYPGSYHTSDQAGTLYPSDNIILVAAERYADLPASGSSFDRSKPYIVVRGRSTITIRLHILLNGFPLSVPLGTNLGELLRHYGLRYGADSRVYLRRQTGIADLAPMEIRLDWSGESLAGRVRLLPGDRIEV